MAQLFAKGLPTTPFDTACMHHLCPPASLLPFYKQAKCGVTDKGGQIEAIPVCPGLENIIWSLLSTDDLQMH